MKNMKDMKIMRAYGFANNLFMFFTRFMVPWFLDNSAGEP